MNWTSFYLSLSLRCSFKKYNNNAPVPQHPGEGTWNVDSSDSSATRAVQNGAHQQQPTQSKLYSLDNISDFKISASEPRVRGGENACKFCKNSLSLSCSCSSCYLLWLSFPIFTKNWTLFLMLFSEVVPEAPVSKTSSDLKPTDASTLKTTRPVPKSPSSNVTNASSEAKAQATPGKGTTSWSCISSS